ncbi:MAG: glycosyltransferase family 4 protein [Cytophagaceae bacterium]|nr:glycosyltransferase family 4 protein [Cytophagaceae bacterium]
MHIAILAPIHRSFISFLLPNYLLNDLPEGYNGAPWIGPMLAELVNQGHTVTVITTSIATDGEYSTKLFNCKNFTWIVVASRKHSFRMNGLRLGRIVDFFFYEQKQMLDNIKVLNPDIIHAFWSYEFAGVAIKSKLPCLVTVHDNAHEVLRHFKNLYRFFRLLMSELYLSRVKYASTPSPYLYNYVQSRCEKVEIIPNPVFISNKIDQIKLKINKRVEKFNSPKIIMIFNGWDSLKNGNNALVAFNLFLDNSPNATLHLYGNGTELYGNAYIHAKSLNIRNVYFNGFASHEMIFQALNDSHLLLHPSLEESFGVVLIEAMSLGIPCIGGYNSGAVPWVINNEQLLVDVLNPNSISDKLLALFTSSDFYIESALLGYMNVKDRFSVKNVVESYLSLYDRILQKK